MSLLDRWRQRAREHTETHVGLVCPHCHAPISQEDMITDVGGPVVFLVGFVAMLGVVASLVMWLLG